MLQIPRKNVFRKNIGAGNDPEEYFNTLYVRDDRKKRV
jgi:hypothetical protein